VKATVWLPSDVRGRVIAVSIVCCVTTLFVIAFMRADEGEFTTGRLPVQFYRELEAQGLLDDYVGVFAIAHNSGDSLVATREAIDHGADVIEIDVASIGSELYAAHRSPLPLVGRRLFRGPTLADVWGAATAVEVVKLDLKESSPRFVNLLLDFLHEREPRETVVVSPSLRVLGAVEVGAPHAVRVLTVADGRRLDELLRNPAITDVIDGVSVAHAALTAGRIAALRERGLLTFAYTVNDLDRLNELVIQGVDAVSTDNLAIMELLGGPRLGEARLRDRAVPPASLHSVADARQ